MGEIIEYGFGVGEILDDAVGVGALCEPTAAAPEPAVPGAEPDGFAAERAGGLPLPGGGEVIRAGAVGSGIGVGGQLGGEARHGGEEVGDGTEDAVGVGGAHVDVAQAIGLEGLDNAGNNRITGISIKRNRQVRGGQAQVHRGLAAMDGQAGQFGPRWQRGAGGMDEGAQLIGGGGGGLRKDGRGQGDHRQ